MKYVSLYPKLTDKATLINDWQLLINETANALHKRSEKEASERPASDKWSDKEILGHPCDSAINNYGRFIRAQNEEPIHYVKQYDQDSWVRLGSYQNRSWSELIELWVLLNKANMAVIDFAGEEAWSLPVQFDDDEATFGILIQDYLGHMKHHFTQLGL